jgi:hypothetical protein
VENKADNQRHSLLRARKTRKSSLTSPGLYHGGIDITFSLCHSISAPTALPAGLDPSAPAAWISRHRRPRSLGNDGLDPSAPAALPAGLDLSAMILSRRFNTGDCSAQFGIGIGIGLGLDFPSFTLLE